jgi:N-succinyldiaminopimelate aminotransferase
MTYMANRVEPFGTTIFSEINALARKYGAVNLGQGAPDFDAPPAIIQAAADALHHALNQYSPGLGYPEVRRAIAAHSQRFYGQTLDPDTEVAVMAGATEGVLCSILGLLDPGDEAIVFQPAYDSYGPQLRMAGVSPRFVNLRTSDWTFDPAELAAAFTPRTRAVLVNTPNNPTGKVFSRAELSIIAELCQQHDVVAITDEVYEHLLYDGVEHIRLATLPGMAERTLTVGSLGKTFSVTGWKIGWVVGSADLVASVIRAHQYNTFCVASPLQMAAVAALAMPDSYFAEVKTTFQARRDYLLNALQGVGFVCWKPPAGYFIVADWRTVAPRGISDDLAFTHWLIEEIGVACIPISAFYLPEDRALGQSYVRFAICKTEATLQAAVERLEQLRVSLPRPTG